MARAPRRSLPAARRLRCFPACFLPASTACAVFADRMGTTVGQATGPQAQYRRRSVECGASRRVEAVTSVLHVYSRATEPWVLIPSAQEPGVEARLRYGRLSYVGAFPSHRLSSEEHAQVMVQCDAGSFAAVPARTALRLLDGDGAGWLARGWHWLRPARKAPRGKRRVIG